jgi:hypothetical protein
MFLIFDLWENKTGPPERDLKSGLVELFRRHGGVNTAYLAQVAYGQSVAVALGLRLRWWPLVPDRGLVEKVGTSSLPCLVAKSISTLSS